MKVLFQSRKTLFSVPGGDTIQMLKTKEYLEKLDVCVDISTELEPDVSGYDVVHAFNLSRPQEVYLQVRNAKRYRKPVALSTIHVVYTEYDRLARNGLAGFAARVLGENQIEYAKIAARAVLNRELDKGTLLFFLHGYRALQKRICDLADIYLPNSESEMNRVAHDLALSSCKYAVVPNAVDTALFSFENSTVSADLSAYRGCILCVARIEGRKNQLNLVRAVKGLPWKLVLIGKPAPNHVDYYERIQKEAGENVIIVGAVPHEKLPAYYKAAKVHVLPSWMETTGLSSLEAGAMGCSLVITEKGDTRDYFGDDALYCEPDSVQSIRKALIRAYESPASDALRERITRDFRWERAAERTLEGYGRIFTPASGS
jgi:glycosyltransferase involved in cell wall biosynthesis